MNICLNIDIVTIFPEVFYGPFSESIMKRAMEKGLVGINTVDLRNFTDDRHRTVDDRPYGGGPGMLMKPEPFYKAVDSLRRKDTKVLLMSPDGEMFTQAIARELAAETHIVILCGHYEGVDERVGSGLADRILTIGDYVMTNGNIAAMAVAEMRGVRDRDQPVSRGPGQAQIIVADDARGMLGPRIGVFDLDARRDP